MPHVLEADLILRVFVMHPPSRFRWALPVHGSVSAGGLSVWADTTVATLLLAHTWTAVLRHRGASWHRRAPSAGRSRRL